MKIFIHEISDFDTDLDFTQDEKWVADAVAQVDEKTEGESVRPAPPKNRPIHAHFSLRKVDEVIVISGKIKTHVQLVCSRCAAPFAFNTQPGFSALFCKDPVMAGVGHIHRESGDKRDPGRPMGQNKGFARHAHDDSEETGTTSKDLDITYISSDFIDLADVLAEQLQLQVPFQPLCNEECKGMCSHCGADLNVGRCACAKLATARPFSVLRDFKV